MLKLTAVTSVALLSMLTTSAFAGECPADKFKPGAREMVKLEAVGVTDTSIVDNARVRSSAAPKPIARPAALRRRPSLNTSRRIRARSAPQTMRIPSSGVRILTVVDSRP